MPIDDALKALLADFDVHEDVSAYFDKVGLRTLDALAVHLDSRTEVQTKILDHVPSQRANVATSLALKQAWRVANDEYERKRGRAKQGWAEEELDAPLAPEDQSRCYQGFLAKHHFSFRSFESCSDTLFGRLYREATKWTMTFCKIDKIRDLKQTQVLPTSKRARLTAHIMIDLATEDVKGSIPTPMHYIHGVRILCNMWAVTGLHKVQSRNGGGEIVYAPLADCLNYIAHVEERTLTVLGRNPQAQHGFVLSWLRAADEATRTRVMELVRSDPKSTIGEALRAAVPECAHEWTPPAAASQPWKEDEQWKEDDP